MREVNKNVFKTKNKASANLLVIGIIILMVLAVGAISGCLENLPFQQGEVTPPTGITCATFDITPTGTTIAVLNAEKTGFMISGYANTTAHTLKRSDNTTSWANPVCTFGIIPKPPSGSFDVSTGCTLYYEVAPADISIDTSTGGTYKLFTLSGGNRQLIWQDGSKTDYISGSKAMLLTNDSTSLTLTFTVNQDSMSRIETTYSPVSVYITFSNGCEWSEIYKVDFMLLGTYA
jgi:hypothetical protein